MQIALNIAIMKSAFLSSGLKRNWHRNFTLNNERSSRWNQISNEGESKWTYSLLNHLISNWFSESLRVFVVQCINETNFVISVLLCHPVLHAYNICKIWAFLYIKFEYLSTFVSINVVGAWMLFLQKYRTYSWII